MGKPEIQPPTTRKWPNLSPSNFARVTTSGSPTMQNFITMRSGVFDPRIREIVFTWLLFLHFSFVGSSDKLAPKRHRHGVLGNRLNGRTRNNLSETFTVGLQPTAMICDCDGKIDCLNRQCVPK